MEKHKSSFKKVEKKEGVVVEEKDNELKNWTKTLLTKTQEKFPFLEKVINSSGHTLRVLTALIMLQGGQLFAQEDTTNINTKNSFDRENLLYGIQKMSINEIKEKIKPLEKKIPENTKIIFHENFKKEGDEIIKQKEGEVVSDTGTINIISMLSTKNIERETRDFDKGTETETFYIEDYFSIDLKILKDSSNKEIKKSKKIFIASKEEKTSQEAIIEGIKKITQEQTIEIFGVRANKKTESNNKFNSILTSVISCEIISPLIVHIDKIEKTNNGTYIAHLSAQTSEE